MKAALFAVVTAIAMTGCAGLSEIAQGSIDQYARATDGVSQQPAIADSFDIPEDALRRRDPQLAEVMYQLGRKIGKQRYQAKVRPTILIPTIADADWLVANIDRGIASTGWQREAVMLPPDVRLTNAYPSVQITENLR